MSSSWHCASESTALLLGLTCSNKTFWPGSAVTRQHVGIPAIVTASSVCSKLNVDSQQHPVLLTEPPLNPPENREHLAEIMFETFQVPALHIGIQAVLALYGKHALKQLQQNVRPLPTTDGRMGPLQLLCVGGLHCLQLMPLTVSHVCRRAATHKLSPQLPSRQLPT